MLVVHALLQQLGSALNRKTLGLPMVFKQE